MHTESEKCEYLLNDFNSCNVKNYAHIAYIVHEKCFWKKKIIGNKNFDIGTYYEFVSDFWTYYAEHKDV